MYSDEEFMRLVWEEMEDAEQYRTQAGDLPARAPETSSEDIS